MKVLGYFVADWYLIRAFILKYRIIKLLHAKACSFSVSPLFEKSKSPVLPIAKRRFACSKSLDLGVVKRSICTP